MKKLLQLLVVSLLLTGNIYSQNPIVQQVINSVDIDSLVNFVRELSGDVATTINGQPYTILSRNKNQPGNDKAADYIKERLEYYGLTAYDQWWTATGRNVYAVQPGTDFPNQYYIICAHYDDMPSGTTAPGADDNASGTAAVLEAARLLSQYTFPFTIMYALWDEEEQGLIGSNYFAGQAQTAGDSILGVLNLDMIAYDGNSDNKFEIHTRSVANSLELKDELLDVNTVYNLGIIPIIKNPGSTYSDHASFWNKGYGAILLIEDNNDFHPYYHTINDKIQFFNVPYFEKLSKLAIGTLAKLALNLDMRIDHTPIASTGIAGDITTQATVVTGLTIGTGTSAPRLYYRLNTGSGYSDFYNVTGTPLESTTYSFTIPGVQLGTSVQYYLAAQDNNSNMVVTLPQGGGGYNPPGSTPPSQFYSFNVAPLNYVFYDSAFTVSNWTGVGGWNITTAKFKSAPSSFTDSPGGNYAANTTATMTLNQSIDLPESMSAYLEFWTQWAIETDWDYGQILISTNGGSQWIPLEGNYTNPGTGSFQPNGQPLYDGTQLTWVKEEIDISEYMGQQVLLRFLLRSDTNIQEDGWYVDDINIVVYDFVPVELVAFTAITSSDKVTLNWSTASETNNRGFEIERKVFNPQSSVSNSEWRIVGYVDGKGTTTDFTRYTFVDQLNEQGKYSYRLKQIDFDGSINYSNEIEVDFIGVTEYALLQNYPNPFNPSTVISYQLPVDSKVQLKVYDVLGTEIITLVNEIKSAGKHDVSFNAGKLSSGTYFYTILTDGFVQTKKMLLVK
ncbi:MAG: M28 family peptidase [Ignavibacteriaceae bacterium]